MSVLTTAKPSVVGMFSNIILIFEETFQYQRSVYFESACQETHKIGRYLHLCIPIHVTKQEYYRNQQYNRYSSVTVNGGNHGF